jgi:hypothetical protein
MLFRLGALARPALLLALVMAASGCSGGAAPASNMPPPPTPDAGDDSSPPGDGWQGQTNIEAIFESSCTQCHGTLWSTCWNVQACATIVDNAVSSGAMPRNGPLPPSEKSALLDWLGQGAPCSGAKPADDDAGCMVPLGGASTAP